MYWSRFLCMKPYSTIPESNIMLNWNTCVQFSSNLLSSNFFRPIYFIQSYQVRLSFGQLRLVQVWLGQVRIGRNGLDENRRTKTGWTKNGSTIGIIPLFSFENAAEYLVHVHGNYSQHTYISSYFYFEMLQNLTCMRYL